MKKFTSQNFFAAVAAFFTVLFYAIGGGTAGEGIPEKDEKKQK